MPCRNPSFSWSWLLSSGMERSLFRVGKQPSLTSTLFSWCGLMSIFIVLISDHFFRAQFSVPPKWATSSPLSPTCLLPKALGQRSSGCSIQPQTSTLNPRMGASFVRRMFEVISGLKIYISATRIDQESACYVTSPSKLNLGHTWPLSARAVRERAHCSSIGFALRSSSNLLCRIQLIERFYDPLAGDVYVSRSRNFN